LLQGYAFGANSKVNITYLNTTGTNWIPIANLVQADDLGQFNYSLTAPDMKMLVTPAGSVAYVPTPIIFNAKYTAGDGYNATYNENPRGLKRIDTNTAVAPNLYGQWQQI